MPPGRKSRIELLNPNTDHREAEVVLELHVIVVAQGLDRRRDFPVLHWVIAPGTSRRFFSERCMRVGWVQRVFTSRRGPALRLGGPRSAFGIRISCRAAGLKVSKGAP